MICCNRLLLYWRTSGWALPYWRLDAKRPYLLPSSKPCVPRNSRTGGHHQLSSAI